MILDWTRKFIPIEFRQSFGLWTAEQASRSKILIYPYFKLLAGQIPKNLTLVGKKECYVDYKGHKIFAPRDGILAFIEVLQDEIYEKVYRPQEGDIVIDVGAYVGMFSIKTALKVGRNGMVIAIEPSISNFTFLEGNTWEFQNIFPFKIGLSEEDKEEKLYLSHASACHTLIPSHKKYEAIKLVTLDNLAETMRLRKVDFVKIDAEGSEMKILKGAVETIRNCKPVFSIAAYHNLPEGGPELPIIKAFLIAWDYLVTEREGYIYAK
jgi:FkbM family methyltransferase